jgi:EmrB/QacA subfamily drug resistance transporter
VALGVASLAVFIITLDGTVLNVALPTILHDFGSTLPAVQWVVTGYALTFATLLVIGGRLGDIHGHRKVFSIGAWLFSAGSLLAVVSWSVGSLIVGEALIEGIGASLMMPATLAIISTRFEGSERAFAFAVWGGVVGVAAALGPVIGGILTTDFSWRWAFGINLLCAPVAAIGIRFSARDHRRTEATVDLDVAGAALIASGMFLLVYAITEGANVGWLAPGRSVTVAGQSLWPQSWPISITPVLLGLAAVPLASFVAVERSKERRHRAPLFEFSQLQHRGFRYGILVSPIVAMTQLGLLFALPVFLQEAGQLSASVTGWWLLPLGATIALSAPLGARLTRRIGTTRVVRVGMLLQTVGLFAIASAVDSHTTFLQLLPGLVVVGTGLGFATSQLTNVILSDVEAQHAGVASGVNATVRQAGVALGIAVIGAILATQTVRHTLTSLHASHAAATFKQRAEALIQQHGGAVIAPPGTPARDGAALRRAVDSGVAFGTRSAILVVAVIALVGTLVSLLIPTATDDASLPDHTPA